jgi:toxin FitB
VNFLLDTNVLSELRKRERGDPRVLRWTRSVGWGALHTSWIAIAELKRGAVLARRHDQAQGRALDTWIAEVLARMPDRILPVDGPVAEIWANLMVPDPRPPMDALLAATALVHALTLVTRNTRDFAGTGIELLDPWKFDA